MDGPDEEDSQSRSEQAIPGRPDSDAGHPTPRSRWTESDALRLHWLDSATAAARESDAGSPLPLVFVPGMGEEALDHTALVDTLAPRRVIVPDLRGRGPSDAPTRGYALADHVRDLDAILSDAGVDRVHVGCYSRGTAYALKWAIEHPTRVASITIGDYPAEHIVPPSEAAEALATRDRFGRPISDRVARRVIEAVFAACTRERYYSALAAIDAPILLVYGGRRSSLVDPDVLARYRAARPDLETEVFAESGHDLWTPDFDRFARKLAAFVENAERLAPG